MKVTEYQKKILYELDRGGKIFAFDFPVEYGFDDVDGNSFAFRKDTFRNLENSGLISVSDRPSLTCTVYGISENGLAVLKGLRFSGIPFLPIYKSKIK